MQNWDKYNGEPLTPRIAESLILTLFAGTPKIRKLYIVRGGIEFHKSQGGLDPNGPLNQYIAHALTKLSASGYAVQLGGGYWSILPIYNYD